MTNRFRPPGRCFVPTGVDCGNWSGIEPLFHELEHRPSKSVDALERWLIDLSELSACIEEVRAAREVAAAAQTDDPECERRYLDFIENVVPHVRRAQDRLDRRLLADPFLPDLDPNRYGILLRRVRNHVELFRDENVPLQTRDETLRQEYQKIAGAMTVTLDGRELTLEEAGRYLERPERGVRQQAWEAIWQRRLRDAAALDALFDEMVQLRDRIARNAGCRDYREYAFRELERFDYAPDDCLRFHATIERLGVSQVRSLHERRRHRLGVSTLRPWDLSVDPAGRDPLRPFRTTGELVEGCRKIFARIDFDLAEQFSELHRLGLLDLASRKGKAPGGFMTVFEERRLPFIFMNAVGVHRDVETLLHESGHAFHALATRDEPLLAYRSAPIEFAEVASMGMELLAAGGLDEFYAPPEARRAVRDQLEDIVEFFPWMASVDAYQHWVYTNPQRGAAERRAAWCAIRRRFGGLESYEGYEDALAWGWQRQLHLYTVPFYYVEYGIAQLGALQIWQRAQHDFPVAVRDYRRALALGGTQPLDALFAAAGAKFDFSEAIFRGVADSVTAALGELSDA